MPRRKFCELHVRKHLPYDLHVAFVHIPGRFSTKKRGWRGAHATHLLFVPLIKRVLPDHCRSPGAYGKSPIVDVYSSRISKGILKRAYSTTGGNSKLVSRNCRVAGSWAQVSSYIGSEPAGSTFSHSDSMPAASFRLVTLAALTSLIPLI